jgi:hypothetical protein
MTWETFYLICFVLGLSLTLLSFAGVFSHLQFGHFHLNLGHGHGGGPAGHGHGAGGGKGGISPFNGFTLAAFLGWFGGCGYLLERYANFLTPIVLGVATLTGLVGAAVLFWFLAKVLLPHERELTAEETAVVGVLGRVSGTIREGGTGEIQFSQNGARRFAVARSEAGVAIPRDVEVVVMRYEQGIAWVRRWDEVSEDWPSGQGLAVQAEALRADMREVEHSDEVERK